MLGVVTALAVTDEGFLDCHSGFDWKVVLLHDFAMSFFGYLNDNTKHFDMCIQ